jgi:Signal peptidase, peptidase S26
MRISLTEQNSKLVKFSKFLLLGYVGFVALYLYIPWLDVIDTSMGTALPPGSKVVLIRSLDWDPPKRGQLVTFQYPPRVLKYLRSSVKYRAHYGDAPPPFTLTKRVVGIPGDQEIWQGKTIKLGPDEFWLEGDDKKRSIDSRAWFFGPVPRTALLGHAYVIFRGKSNAKAN